MSKSKQYFRDKGEIIWLKTLIDFIRLSTEYSTRVIGNNFVIISEG